MNQRERMLLIALIAIVGGGGVLFIGNKWFVQPLLAAKKSIVDAESALEDLDAQILTFEADQQMMELVKRKSLPTDQQLAASEYTFYLQSVLSDAKLIVEDIIHTQASEFKTSVALPLGIKKTGHQVIQFTVQARGELGPLVKAINVIQRTPYEHRIRTLNISRAEPNVVGSTKLGINMIIETLLVAKSESKVGIPPGIDPVVLILDGLAARQGTTPLGWGLSASMAMIKLSMPAPSDFRQYSRIADRNIFTDPKTWKDNPDNKRDGSKESPLEAPPEFVPQYVRLVQTEPTSQTAYLRNLIYNTRETKLIAKQRSGFEQFRITDEDHEFVYFTGKILRVEPRDIYFQIKDKVYGMHIGQSFADVLGQDLSGENYLSIFKLDELDLDYDRAWAKTQISESETPKVASRKKTPTADTETPAQPEKKGKFGNNNKKKKGTNN